SSVSSGIRRTTRLESCSTRGTSAAYRPGQGDGGGQSHPDDATTPQKAPNKANLESEHVEARPHPERCPRPEPLGRNRPAAFTLCYKVSGPSARPRALSQWTRGKEMEMIENCQNRVGFSGVCHCQTTTCDKKSEVPQGALSAAETSETSTNLNRTPVQYR